MYRFSSSEIYVVSVTGHVTSNILKNHNAFMFSVQNSNNCPNLTDPIEITVTTYPTGQHHNTEEVNLQKLHCGNLKCHTIMVTLPER